MTKLKTVIKPDSLAFHNGAMVLTTNDIQDDLFWLILADAIPPILFKQIKEIPSMFAAIEPPVGLSEAPPWRPLQRVYLQGVWWTRRAALEAESSMSSFLLGLDRHD